MESALDCGVDAELVSRDTLHLVMQSEKSTADW